MTTWTLRLGMSLMVVVAFWADRLPAQEPVLIVPVVPYEPAHHPTVPPAFYVPPPPTPAPHAVGRMLNNHGINCAVNPFFPACANWHYEVRFAFGSCRSFFGENCPANSNSHSHCGSRR